MNTNDEFARWVDEWMGRVDRGEVPGPRKWRGAKPPPTSRSAPKQFQPQDGSRAVAAAMEIISQHQRRSE